MSAATGTRSPSGPTTQAATDCQPVWVVTSSMICGITSASEVASLAAVAIEVSRARACSASLVAVMSCDVPPIRMTAPVSSVPT